MKPYQSHWDYALRPVVALRGFEEASVRALLKLEQVLPPRLRHRVAALHGFVVPLESRGPTIDAKLLSMIAGACRDYEGIRFKYNDRSGAPSMLSGRAAPIGPYGISLVSGRMGQRPQGLANISHRPDRRETEDLASFQAAHTAGRRLRQVRPEIAISDSLSFSSPSYAACFRGEPCEPDSGVSGRA